MNWAEKYEWTTTGRPHIWFNIDRQKYHFSDETEMFDETEYDTIDECGEALNKYCEDIHREKA